MQAARRPSARGQVSNVRRTNAFSASLSAAAADARQRAILLNISYAISNKNSGFF